jgi:hypothetical protein
MLPSGSSTRTLQHVIQAVVIEAERQPFCKNIGALEEQYKGISKTIS